MVSGSRTRPAMASGSRTRPRDGEREVVPASRWRAEDATRLATVSGSLTRLRDGERKSYPPRDGGHRDGRPAARWRRSPPSSVERPEENRSGSRPRHDDPFIPGRDHARTICNGARAQRAEDAEQGERRRGGAPSRDGVQAHRRRPGARASARTVGIPTCRPHRDRARDPRDHRVRDRRLRARAARAAHVPAHLRAATTRSRSWSTASAVSAGPIARSRSVARSTAATLPDVGARRTRDRDVGRAPRPRSSPTVRCSNSTSRSWTPTRAFEWSPALFAARADCARRARA